MNWRMVSVRGGALSGYLGFGVLVPDSQDHRPCRHLIKVFSQFRQRSDDIGGRNVVRLAFSIIAESQNLADVMREYDHWPNLGIGKRRKQGFRMF